MNQTERTRGPKGPPKELLAAALRIYSDPECNREDMPEKMRRAAKRMNMLDKLPGILHPNTIYNWKNKAVELGLTVEYAETLFQGLEEEVEG